MHHHVGKFVVFQFLPWLGRTNRYGVLVYDVFQTDNPLLDEVSDKVTPKIDVLGVFVGHKVVGHIHTPWLPIWVGIDRGWCGDLHKLIQSVKDVQSARVHHRQQYDQS